MKKGFLGRFGGAAILVVAVAILLAVPASRHAVFDFFGIKGADVAGGAYYTCPMHPEIRLPQPGECPICGMTLVKKEAGQEDESGRISVTPRQIQLTGVTTEPLHTRMLDKEIDTYGKIDYDETRLGIVSAWVGGRIDRLYVDFTGVTVNKGHPLVYLYSPDLISTEKEYLLAATNLKRIEKSNMPQAIANARDLVNSSKQRLLWWGLSERQITDLKKQHKIEDHITIYAPQGGTVIHKRAYEGMYVKEGDVLFRIADLSRVWLYADVYEDEVPFLYQKRPDDYYACAMHPWVTSPVPGTCSECGMDLTRTNPSIKVELSTRAFPGEVFEGSISFTDPFLDPETRTVRVRVNIDNPDRKLKPDMYARVKIKLPVGDVLAVPENAVIHSGERTIVVVDEGGGKFRPQPVRLGRMWLNDPEREMAEHSELVFKREALRFHEVLAGLDPGESVVTSGNFLLGSESQLQGALAKMIEQTDSEGADQEETAPSYEFAEEDSLDALLEAYYVIGAALAADTLGGVPEQAEKIQSAAESPSLKALAEPLRHAEHKNDIKATRSDFKALSNSMIAYLELHKSHVKDLPVRIYCPMKDAFWLQQNEEKKNPYFGSSMLTCGTVEPWEN